MARYRLKGRETFNFRPTKQSGGRNRVPRWESGIRSLTARISIRVATRRTNIPAFHSRFRFVEKEEETRIYVDRGKREEERKNFRESGDRVVKIADEDRGLILSLVCVDTVTAILRFFPRFEPRIYTYIG